MPAHPHTPTHKYTPYTIHHPRTDTNLNRLSEKLQLIFVWLRRRGPWSFQGETIHTHHEERVLGGVWWKGGE